MTCMIISYSASKLFPIFIPILFCFFLFLFFFLSIILYAICTGYTVVQSTKQVCTQIREIKAYNIIIIINALNYA